MIIYLIEITFKNKKVITKIVILYYIISMIISLFFPYYLYRDVENKMYYTYGPAINYVYISSALGCLFIGIILFIKRRNISKKKSIPIYLFMLFGIVSAVIQMFRPEIVIITVMESFICFLMYFTIENPDTKVLEEVHKAKEISDNANEEKTMFLYNMTNEIRNITKDINYSADGILEEADNKEVNIENIKTDARDIKGSTAKFTTMTNEILDISSIDSSNIKIYNEKYNIKLIIKEVYALYKSKCDSKNIDFRLNVSSDVPEYLYGDSVGLKRILLIILDNSVKYTDKGYIEFNINTIVKHDICRVIISIEDSGCGIKADDLVKVFNKKGENQEEDNSLYTAKKLITLMGGTIIPSSVYDKGTTIKIVLDQKIVNESNNDLEKYEKEYDKKRVLLVDDNEASAKIIAKLLEKTNIVLESVNLGSECLDKIRNKEKYDLILLDEDMKPLDGITIMKKLQNIRSFNTKVILLTHNNNYEYSEEYLKYGFSDYVLKPIDKEKFKEKMNKYLK
ncbi:MAG: response regulator [Bacilli bacterium]